MKEPARMWAVSLGEYSDYSIACICGSEEVADAICAKLSVLSNSSYGDYFVESFAFVETVDDVIAYSEYVVWIDKDGNELRRWDNSEYHFAGQEIEERQPIKMGDSGASAVSFRGYEQALKGAREYLASQKALAADIA